MGQKIRIGIGAFFVILLFCLFSQTEVHAASRGILVRAYSLDMEFNNTWEVSSFYVSGSPGYINDTNVEDDSVFICPDLSNEIAGTYHFNGTVEDSYGEARTFSGEFTTDGEKDVMINLEMNSSNGEITYRVTRQDQLNIDKVDFKQLYKNFWNMILGAAVEEEYNRIIENYEIAKTKFQDGENAYSKKDYENAEYYYGSSAYWLQDVLADIQTLNTLLSLSTGEQKPIESELESLLARATTLESYCIELLQKQNIKDGNKELSDFKKKEDTYLKNKQYNLILKNGDLQYPEFISADNIDEYNQFELFIEQLLARAKAYSMLKKYKDAYDMLTIAKEYDDRQVRAMKDSKKSYNSDKDTKYFGGIYYYLKKREPMDFEKLINTNRYFKNLKNSDQFYAYWNSVSIEINGNFLKPQIPAFKKGKTFYIPAKLILAELNVSFSTTEKKNKYIVGGKSVTTSFDSITIGKQVFVDYQVLNQIKDLKLTATGDTIIHIKYSNAKSMPTIVLKENLADIKVSSVNNPSVAGSFDLVSARLENDNINHEFTYSMTLRELKKTFPRTVTSVPTFNCLYQWNFIVTLKNGEMYSIGVSFFNGSGPEDQKNVKFEDFQYDIKKRTKTKEGYSWTDINHEGDDSGFQLTVAGNRITLSGTLPYKADDITNITIKTKGVTDKDSDKIIIEVADK